MQVDDDLLRGGASRCADAAKMALAGASELTDKSPTAGIFGDFTEAYAFHEALSAAHQAHVDRLRGHHRALTRVGENGHAAANEFTAADASCADSIRAAEAGFEVG